jgi:hypothetical protein
LAADVPFLAAEEVLSVEEVLVAEEVFATVDLAAEELLPGEEALAGEDVLAGKAGTDVFCGFSAEEATGSELARDIDRISVRSAETTVDSAVDCKRVCKGLALTRGFTAFLRCESMARID